MAGVDWECPDCGSIIALTRREAHTQFWCTSALKVSSGGERAAIDQRRWSDDGSGAHSCDADPVSPGQPVNTAVGVCRAADAGEGAIAGGGVRSNSSSAPSSSSSTSTESAQPPSTEKLVAWRRQQLGDGHPKTLAAVARLGRQRARVGDHVAAASLLSEACRGYTALEGQRLSRAIAASLRREEEALQHRCCYSEQLRSCQRTLERVQRRQRAQERSASATHACLLFLFVGPGLCASAMLGWELCGESLQHACEQAGLCEAYDTQYRRIILRALAPPACVDAAIDAISGEMGGSAAVHTSSAAAAAEWRACVVGTAGYGAAALKHIDRKLSSVARVLRKHRGSEVSLLQEAANALSRHGHGAGDDSQSVAAVRAGTTVTEPQTPCRRCNPAARVI
jgi:hypothetical protein|eukprot:COSAG01_NODE_2387_length_7782_cov_1207.598985_4_plen_396_part_00